MAKKDTTTSRAGKAADEGLKTAQDTARQGAESGKAGFDAAADASLTGLEQLRRSLSGTDRVLGQVAGSMDDEMTVMMQSSARVAQGMQEMTLHMVQYAQEQMRKNLQLASDMMECRSVEDMLAAQRSYMRDSMDGLLNEGGAMLRLSSDLARQSLPPQTLFPPGKRE